MKTRLNNRHPFPIILGTLMLLFLAMSSCIKPDYFPCIRPNGLITEETRLSPAFEGVELRLHGQVFIEHGPSHSIVIETSENLLGYIQTRVSAGKLIIEHDRCMRCRMDDINIFITMPMLNTVNLAGSGRMILDDEWDADQVWINVTGSGEVSGTFTSEQMHTRISGSGNVLLKGKTIEHAMNISGSGQVTGTDMECKVADVRISGSGNAKIKVSQHLEARITGSGSIYFWGDPTVSSSISGTGKLVKY